MLVVRSDWLRTSRMKIRASSVVAEVRTLAFVLLAGCGSATPASTPAHAPVKPTAQPTVAEVHEPVEVAWERQLAHATPALRERARSYLDLCTVIEMRDDEDTPILACDPDSFAEPRALHTFRVGDAPQAYSIETVDVRGALLAADSEDRLVVLGGETNGASGGVSGFVFTRHGDDWSLARTYAGFPATSCALLPRTDQHALLLCAFENPWQEANILGVGLFDPTASLVPDPDDTPSPTRGTLLPLQKLLEVNRSYESLTRCPAPTFMRNLALFPRAPIRVHTTPSGADVSVRRYDVTRKEAIRARCGEEDDPPTPDWPSHDVTYSYTLVGQRMQLTGSAQQQDRELRALGVVRPRSR